MATTHRSSQRHYLYLLSAEPSWPAASLGRLPFVVARVLARAAAGFRTEVVHPAAKIVVPGARRPRGRLQPLRRTRRARRDGRIVSVESSHEGRSPLPAVPALVLVYRHLL